MAQIMDGAIVDIGKAGACIITVGAGLMQASVDALAALSVPVHCAMDAGRLETAQLGSLVDWATADISHDVVALHVWRSRGTLDDLYPLLELAARRAKIEARLKGEGERGQQPDFDEWARLTAMKWQAARRLRGMSESAALEAVRCWDSE